MNVNVLEIRKVLFMTEMIEVPESISLSGYTVMEAHCIK
jgi:hypothetical protein